MNAKRWTLLFTLFILLAGLGAQAAQAQDLVTPEPPVFILPDWDTEGLRIEFQRVNVTIEDQVATTHVEQLFVNENDWMLEGTYLFPLPPEAAVSQLTMWVDGKPIEAKILEKDEARDIYDTIVRQLRDPALLEYVGSSAIQANVFPIPPQEERRIEIEYTQVLPAENGLVHFVYPQSTSLYTNTPLDQQSIRVELSSNEPIHAIYSPSHAVSIDRQGEYQAVIGYEAGQVFPEDDFELYYTVSPEEIGLNLLSYRQPGEDGFFMLLAAPPVESQAVVAKDVIIVLDTSGSMEGQKIDQAREAALFIVEHLNPADRFNIIPFSTGVRRFASELLPSQEAGGYAQFINSLEAVGGTNISAALLEAAGQADAERPTTIIFMTDGLATEGIIETGLLLNAVAEATPTNVRIFAFGVGNDVDPNLLDSLAENHRGTTTYVRPGQSIEEEVSSFYAKVSSPVLANISLDFDGVTVEELYPQTLPDLFAGSQLILVGRYRQGGPAEITLSGEVNGIPQRFIYTGNEFRDSGRDEFIPRLWATRAIGHLLRQIRLQGENDELVQSVVNLSIRYGIITPYTSYLIEEDDIFSQTGRQGIVQDEMEAAPLQNSVGGAAAVEEAAAQAEMFEAEAPMPLPTQVVSGLSPLDSEAPLSAAEMVRYAGSKTFIWRDGVWIDTAFDEDQHQVREVDFASDAYFDLLSTTSEVGQYLSLGPEVLVVVNNVAYKVLNNADQGSDAEPEVLDNEGQEMPTQTIEAGQPGVEPGEQAPAQNQTADSTAAGNGNCAALAGFPLLIVLGMGVSRYGRRQQTR